MIIGIDCGVVGAIAFLNDNLSCLAVFDMPTMTLRGNKRQINAAELSKILMRQIGGNLVMTQTYLEQAAARPGQGVSGVFNFGVSYGIVQGVLAALKISMVLVTPATWKRRASLIGKEKDEARTLAQRLFPGVDLAHKKDVGRADAILIAYFMGKEEK